MTVLEKVKTALRLSSTAFDEGEILPLIEAAEQDLTNAGIEKNENNALYTHAVVLYVKGSFGYDKDNERFTKAYEALKISLALVGGSDEA